MIRKQLNQRVMTLKQDQASRSAGHVKKEGCDYRLEKDMGELDLEATTAKLGKLDPDNLREFDVTLTPSEGFYQGGTFEFHISVPSTYPHEPPKATCKTKIYHPNIDEEGKVCLNILRADWKPVLTMKAVLYGLELLFIEPNPDDPLNKEAARVFREDKRTFARTVERWMKGQYY